MWQSMPRSSVRINEQERHDSGDNYLDARRENARLKRMYADKAMETEALRDLIEKKL